MSRPLVTLSLDDSWWNRLRMSTFTYEHALRRAGARVLRVGVRATDLEEESDVARAMIEQSDALVLTGGGDVSLEHYGRQGVSLSRTKPRRDRFELSLLAKAQEQEMPVLAICRGAQLLNAYHGGTLHPVVGKPDRINHWGRPTHPVELDSGSLAAEIFEVERLPEVASYHKHAIDQPGDGLRITGRAPDGVAEVVEADSSPADQWKVGVQWHPEIMYRSTLQSSLWRALVDAARDSNHQPPETS